jgi:hypothetical protein
MPKQATRLVVGLAVLSLASVAWAQTPAEAPPTEDAPAPAPATPEAAPAEAAPAAPVAAPAANPGLSPGDQARADRYWDEGEQFYGQGRYKEAIEKFSLAFEILQDVNLLYSIAVSYQQLERWQECVNFMDRFLEKAPVGPKRDRAQNARKSCDARIVRDQLLIIESDPPGARVFVDDKNAMRGQTPFRTYVRPGAHKVWIEADGFEPIAQDIEVQVKEPFRINAVLTRIQNIGYLFVDSTIIGATVYINGKNVGLTPFKEALTYPAGRHQVIVERDGYTRFDAHVSVEKGATTTVDAYVFRTEFVPTWRTGVGWTANILGVLSIAGGIVAWQFADGGFGDGEFNDTDSFDQLALYEVIGYSVGGTLLAAGTGLIIWDRARDVVLDKDRNPDYGKPAGGSESGGAAPGALAPGVGFRGFGFQF